MELKDFYDNSPLLHPPCRHKPSLIFSHEEIEVYGCSDMHVDRRTAAEFGLVINLQGYRKFSSSGSLISGPREWGFLKRYTDEAPVQELVFDWKDMGIFPVGRAFWLSLWDGFRRHKVQKVLLFCTGGHGRTGTAVGCLMTVAKNMHGGEAIRIIREKYCERAIETKKQETYVRSMTAKR